MGNTRFIVELIRTYPDFYSNSPFEPHKEPHHLPAVKVFYQNKHKLELISKHIFPISNLCFLYLCGHGKKLIIEINVNILYQTTFDFNHIGGFTFSNKSALLWLSECNQEESSTPFAL